MKTLPQLAKEIHEWSLKNFGDQSSSNPLLGMAEELGELCHAELKGRQNIRHTPEEIRILKKDAIADFVIYLLDYQSRQKHEKPTSDDPAMSALKRVIAMMGRVMEYSRLSAVVDADLQNILHDLETYCYTQNFELMEIVNQTWEQTVSKRNWARPYAPPEDAHLCINCGQNVMLTPGQHYDPIQRKYLCQKAE